MTWWHWVLLVGGAGLLLTRKGAAAASSSFTSGCLARGGTLLSPNQCGFSPWGVSATLNPDGSVQVSSGGLSTVTDYTGLPVSLGGKYTAKEWTR